MLNKIPVGSLEKLAKGQPVMDIDEITIPNRPRNNPFENQMVAAGLNGSSYFAGNLSSWWYWTPAVGFIQMKGEH
jgi:hypothetical protein